MNIPLPLPVDVVNRARVELAKKRACEIHVDTAYVWAARAFVAYNNAHRSMLAGDWRYDEWLKDADEYAGEAAEHAALGELGGCTRLRTSDLVELLKDLRAKAVKAP